LLLPPPQLPNAVALSAAIAAAVTIPHPFDTAIKLQLHGRWQRIQWLWRQGWWASNDNNCNGDGNNTCNGDGNKMVGNKEGDGKSGKSDEDGNKEGKDNGSKSNGNGNEEGNRDGQRGQC
jgi:hypothetical protein